MVGDFSDENLQTELLTACSALVVDFTCTSITEGELTGTYVITTESSTQNNLDAGLNKIYNGELNLDDYGAFTVDGDSF